MFTSKTFADRRKATLDIFFKAKKGLETLNKDITARQAVIEKEMKSLETESKGNSTLAHSNESTLRDINKILGVNTIKKQS